MPKHPSATGPEKEKAPETSRQIHEVRGDEGQGEKASTPDPLPQITHQQFLVIDILMRSPESCCARGVREQMAAAGHAREGPLFYQFMSRLEKAGLIDSRSQEFDIVGESVERTYYRVTTQGRVAWRLTLDFYAVRLEASRNLLKRH